MKLTLLTEQPYWATHAPTRFKGMNVTDPGISREEHIAIAKKAGLDSARRAIQYMYNCIGSNCIGQPNWFALCLFRLIIN